ncbi:MAG TPA: hypothetical protein VNF99_22660 [Stellaceae bacterium]|nr:hypothetical protein [Stellaceae bacterium]
MSGLGRQVAGLAAAAAVAATVGACAAPSPGAAGMAMRVTPASLPGYRAAPPRVPDVKDLAGLRPDEVLAMLGQPDLKRDEPPAELWQYRAADCVLNLFFYDDAGGYRLTHTEAWQRSLSAGTSPARCRDEDAPIKAHLITQSRL